jgi:hypothetical protein
MDRKTLITILAAGIRANPETMRLVCKAAEADGMEMSDVVAIWATTQLDFIEKYEYDISQKDVV